MELILQEIILIICFSISMDYLLGEPPKGIHPVVWIGKIINFFTCQIKKRNNKENNILSEKTWGSILAVSLITTIGTTYLPNNIASILHVRNNSICFTINIYPKINVFDKIHG